MYSFTKINKLFSENEHLCNNIKLEQNKVHITNPTVSI